MVRPSTQPPSLRFFLVTLLLVWTAVGCDADKPAAPAEPAAPPLRATSQPSGDEGSKAGAIKAAKLGFSDGGELQISEGDRCPVCAMEVDKHKKFASGIELVDGTTYHFCGTGCMMKTWLHPEVFVGHDKAKLKRAVTPEYFAGKYIDANEAHWVAGSDVVGAMGPMIVPLATEEDVTTFKGRHGGKTTFKLSDLDDAKWESLTGKKATMRPPGR